MAATLTRTLRGAVAGAAAAGVWVAQQPLDKRVFGIDYDDAHMLGRLVASGPSAYPIGFALHVGNGALLGALYANAAPSLPGPPPLRGPLAALAEHLASWPAAVALDRLHPGPPGPVLLGSGRAFAQATWRHLLFGVILGELERRLNPAREAPTRPDAEAVASNGHGSAEHLVTTGPAPS